MDPVDNIKPEDLAAITSHFGITTEITKLSEEIGELQNACYKAYYTTRPIDNDEITDEMADVFVLLSQLLIYFDIDTDKMFDIFNRKVQRTINRIGDGWYKNHR